MFDLYADKTALHLCRREPLTSGSVNVYRARFRLSAEWEGLRAAAVFRVGSHTVSALLEDGECLIPWELLEEPGRPLFAGVYGVRGDEVVLPTVWANLGTILEGAAPGEEARPPTPDLWEQELAQKGDRLDYTEAGELGLYAGENLLSAVPGGSGAVPDIQMKAHGLPPESEPTVARSGTGANPVFDLGIPAGKEGKSGQNGATFTPSVSAEGLLSWTNDKGFANPEPVNIKGPPGDSGTGGGIPAGCVLLWSGSEEEIPTGFALCDGQDGRPDLRDRFVLGAGTAHPVGATGGEEEHTLTEDEMPEHKHTQRIQSGSSSYLWTTQGSSSGSKSLSVALSNGNGIVPINTAYAGRGTPHNNMPPYYTLCYIIKL